MATDYTKYFVLTVINIAISMLLMYCFVDALDKENYAEYGVLWAAASIFLLFVNLGHKDALFKYTSQNLSAKTSQIWRSSLLICAVTSLILVIVWLYWDSALALSLLAVTGLHCVNMLATYYRGQGKYSSDVFVIILYRISWLILFLLTANYSVTISASTVFLSAVIASGLVFFTLGGAGVVTKYWDKLHFPFNTWQDSTVKHFFLIELVTVTFMKMDVLLLQQFGVKYQYLAEYYFSLQIFEAAILLLSPITFLFFNRYNKMRSASSGSRLLWISILFVSMVFTIGLVTWVIMGQSMLDLLFPDYSSTYEVVLVLTWALLPNALNALLSAYLFANHMEKTFVKISAFGLMVLLLFDCVLIPNFGTLGASYGRLVSEWMITIMLLVIVVKLGYKAKIKT